MPVIEVINKTIEVKEMIAKDAAELIAHLCFATEIEAKKNVVDVKAVDTGNLLGSIHVDNLQPLSGEVVVGAEYGIYVEYGTHKMPARPYFTPAIDKAINSIDKFIKKE